MRGVLFVIAVALFLAGFQACQDNSILKPSCRIFEVDLIEKWWYPVESTGGSFTKIFFAADGQIIKPFENERLNYSLENCNAIRVENSTDLSLDHWTIKRLTDKELIISYGRDNSLTYSRHP